MERPIFNSVFTIFGFLFATFQVPDCSCLRDVKLIIPPFAKFGSTVHLLCEYDLEGEDLYAVKWYKGHQEFYRYVPKESPPGKVFHVPGLTVDISNSSAHEIVLLEVSLDITGIFKCVVSAEQFFQTKSSSGSITVIVIEDDRPPFLQLSHGNHETPSEELSPGENVTARCRSPPTYPPSNITWYLNGINLSHSSGGSRLGLNARISSRRHQHSPAHSIRPLPHHQFLLQWTESLFTFNLPLTSEVVRVRCDATVYSEYNQSSVLSLIPILPRFTPPDTLLNSSGRRDFDSILIIFNLIGSVFIFVPVLQNWKVKFEI